MCEGTPGAVGLAESNGRLDQLGQGPNRRPFRVKALGRCGRGQRGFVVAEAVVETSAQELGGRQREPLAASLGFADRGTDQL